MRYDKQSDQRLAHVLEVEMAIVLHFVGPLLEVTPNVDCLAFFAVYDRAMAACREAQAKDCSVERQQMLSYCSSVPQSTLSMVLVGFASKALFSAIGKVTQLKTWLMMKDTFQQTMPP